MRFLDVLHYALTGRSAPNDADAISAILTGIFCDPRHTPDPAPDMDEQTAEKILEMIEYYR